MGSSSTQGELWGAAPRHWAEMQEPKHMPVWKACSKLITLLDCIFKKNSTYSVTPTSLRNAATSSCPWLVA